MSNRKYIYISDEFRFTTDNHNFILEQLIPEHEVTKGPHIGKITPEQWLDIRVYKGNLQAFIKACIQHGIRDAKGDLSTIYKRVSEVEMFIEEKVPNLLFNCGKLTLKETTETDDDK